MLALESVPGRLGTACPSGVFDGTVPGVGGERTDPIEDIEVSEAAEDMASGCVGVQGLVRGVSAKAIMKGIDSALDFVDTGKD